MIPHPQRIYTEFFGINRFFQACLTVINFTKINISLKISIYSSPICLKINYFLKKQKQWIFVLKSFFWCHSSFMKWQWEELILMALIEDKTFRNPIVFSSNPIWQRLSRKRAHCLESPCSTIYIVYSKILINSWNADLLLARRCMSCFACRLTILISQKMSSNYPPLRPKKWHQRREST